MADPELIKSLAWERPLAKPIPYKPKPVSTSLKALWKMLPGLIRINRWARAQRKLGRQPLFDLVRGGLPISPDKGVPLGGLGCGTVGRGCRGDFNRWSLKPGDYEYRSVDTNQFSLWVRREGSEPEAMVLNPVKLPQKELDHWDWGLDESKVTYRALFPRAWHDYDEPIKGIRLSCRQISPVIPHNYRETSYPASTLVWSIENTGATDVEASLMFTFQNGTGGENDWAGGHANHMLRQGSGNNEYLGIALRHIHRHPRPLDPGQSLNEQGQFEDLLTFGIGVSTGKEIKTSCRSRFSINTESTELWNDFANDGLLENLVNADPSSKGEAIGAAVSAKVSIPPGESRQIVFALVWDMPIARFPSGAGWYRRYTKFYGREGNAVSELLQDALTEYPTWEQAIDDWQMPILSDESLPLWYRQMLFNETYFLVDGGTLWTAGLEGDQESSDPDIPEPEIGHFAYLESHEYRMYNTYDVHFYASFALAMLWPELELSLQRDFSQSLKVSDEEVFTYFFSGVKGPRKLMDVIPHDLGSPLEDPWTKINAYNAQDVSRWKDLNPKFVLQIARDYLLTRDKAFLKEVWPSVKRAIQYMDRFDKDRDGMIENDGYPDQTYDVWTAEGVSAYCGGLWLACLQAGAALAEEMEDAEASKDFIKRFEQAQKVYETVLWNGEYYDYEASASKHQDSIMADQMAGHWYSKACGLGGVIPADHAASALKKVYQMNVLGYKNGRLGAMNGMRPDGELDKTGLQSMEIWTGTTFGVAAAMLQSGLTDEAFKTAKGIFNMVYEDYGLWFQTPEALSAGENVRAISYMRPLSIWAMQWEIEGKSSPFEQVPD